MITKLKPYLVAGLILLAGCSPAAAWISFNITNTIAAGVVITGYPTNPPANYGGTNNGTGNGINVRKHQYAGFVFEGLVNSSATGQITLTLIQAITTNNPPVVTLPGSSFTNSDWETAPTATLTIPFPAGTNAPLTWVTNLDIWIIQPSDYVGISSITNSAGTINNAQCGIKPFIEAVSLDGSP